MSKKNVAQVKAAKRTARAKTKAVSASKAKAAPRAVQQRKMRAAIKIDGRVSGFDTVLEQAVIDANSGKKAVSEFKNTVELVAGMKKAVSEVFKLYCYVTLAHSLIEKGIITDTLNIDLPVVSRVLMDFDRRIGILDYLNQAPEGERTPGVIETEALDIGTSLTTVSEELYNAVVLLEPHSLVIEDTITRLAEEVEEGSPNDKRLKVLQTLAYKYLAELITADKAAEEAAAPAEEVEAPAEVEEPARGQTAEALAVDDSAVAAQ